MPVDMVVALDTNATNPTSVTPVSLTSNWVTPIGPGGMGDADAATITNPDTQITVAQRAFLSREGKHGTTLKVRLKYDAAASGSFTAPRIKLFGRTGSGPWEILRTKSGANSRTLELDIAGDATNGTHKWTTPDDLEDAFDVQGCDIILIGVERALAHQTGNAALATLEAKVV